MSEPLRVLALEPWLGGSHQRFLESLQAHSRHRIEVLGLPARHWKWRMSGSAWTLAARLETHRPADVLLVSDYVDLARLRGLAPSPWRDLPALVYFHENQLTYPLAEGEERDLTHGFTNVLTLLAAEGAAFNSAYHRSEFLVAARELLRVLPRPVPREQFERTVPSFTVIGPGIERDAFPCGPGGDGPLRVVFNQRWEHDKDPMAMLRIVERALALGAELELVLLGEFGADLPAGVAAALARLEPHIRQRGHAGDRTEYADHLGRSDVVISTARHEFYGMAVLEAMCCGARPLLPRRLAYPEVLPQEHHDPCLYSSDVEASTRLVDLARDPRRLRKPNERGIWSAATEPHGAVRSIGELDTQLELLATRSPREAPALPGEPT